MGEADHGVSGSESELTRRIYEAAGFPPPDHSTEEVEPARMMAIRERTGEMATTPLGVQSYKLIMEPALEAQGFDPGMRRAILDTERMTDIVLFSMHARRITALDHSPLHGPEIGTSYNRAMEATKADLKKIDAAVALVLGGGRNGGGLIR